MSRSERILIGLGCLGVVTMLCLGSVGALWLVGTGAVDGESLSATLQQGQEARPESGIEPKAREASEEASDDGEAANEGGAETRERSEDETDGAQPTRLRQLTREQDSVVRESLPLRGVDTSNGSDLTRLYEQVNPGVVSIAVQQTLSFGNQEFNQVGGGSGFVFDDRHIVTNNHVVEGANDIEVVFHDGSRREGVVIGTDAYSDLAVVQVEALPESARLLPVEDDFDSLRVGQLAVAIGAPFGRANSMTYGIISALGRTIPADLDGTSFGIPETIQTDAAINPGNSGGPLLNLSGEVIGINAQINTSNQAPGGVPGNSGVGFAIPASIVVQVVPSLIADGKHTWSYLGVSGLQEERYTVDVARANGLAEPIGAYLALVLEDGPSAGKLRGAEVGPDGSTPIGGDIVIAIDDEPVNTFDDLLTYISVDTSPGQEVELTVLRGGEEVTARVRVGQRPDR